MGTNRKEKNHIITKVKSQMSRTDRTYVANHIWNVRQGKKQDERASHEPRKPQLMWSWEHRERDRTKRPVVSFDNQRAEKK